MVISCSAQFCYSGIFANSPKMYHVIWGKGKVSVGRICKKWQRLHEYYQTRKKKGKCLLKSTSTGWSCDMAAKGRLFPATTSQHLTYFQSMLHKVRNFSKNSNVEHETSQAEIYWKSNDLFIPRCRHENISCRAEAKARHTITQWR